MATCTTPCRVFVGDALTITMELRQCTDDGSQGVIIDISSATPLEIIVIGPTGQRYVLTATLVTDGTDGKMIATISGGKINSVGTWTTLGFIVLGSLPYHTKITEFEVEDVP